MNFSPPSLRHTHSHAQESTFFYYYYITPELKNQTLQLTGTDRHTAEVEEFIDNSGEEKSSPLFYSGTRCGFFLTSGIEDLL